MSRIVESKDPRVKSRLGRIWREQEVDEKKDDGKTEIIVQSFVVKRGRPVCFTVSRSDKSTREADMVVESRSREGCGISAQRWTCWSEATWTGRQQQLNVARIG